MDRVHALSRKKSVSNKDAQPTGDETPADHAFSIKPIGYLDSCFREKFGTPRQSGFVKNARAKLTLVNEINSSCL
jgi:hypothetical protein